MTSREILSNVIDNGRVSGDDEGRFDAEELRNEVAFEASEQGLSDEEVSEAVEYALLHTRNTENA